VQRLAAWSSATLLALLPLTLGGPAQANPRPSPKPSSSTSATPPAIAVTPDAKSSGLDLSVNLGSVHVNATLPVVDVGSLLGAATPTPSRTARPTTTPTTVVPTSHAASSHSQPAGHGAAAPTTGAAYPPTSPHLTHPAPSPSPTPTHRPHPASHPAAHPSIDPRFVFASGSFSGDEQFVLALLCVVCAIGVAIVVRLSGRRRGR